jgi:nucleoredoxin
MYWKEEVFACHTTTVNMSFASLLGVSELLGQGGAKVAVSAIEGKTLLLYFSAHWCPPCKMFTPQLGKFYSDLKKQRDDFETVFVSSDKDQGQFDAYFGEMPFLALPFEARAEKAKLSKKFGVSGIPTLVVLNKDGSVITKNGRAEVSADPEGKKFPWVPPTIFDILGSEPCIKTKDGKTIGVADLKKLDGFAFYFSAHWCPPCRGFTPELASVYNKMKARNANIEFIFASSDKDEAQFNEYWGEMPWATLPFKDHRIEQLSKKCEVEGIPTLVTCDKDGNIITTKARGGAGADPEGKDFPWAPKPLPVPSPLSPIDEVIEALNGSVCVVFEGSDAAKAEAFTNAAKSFDAKQNADRAKQGEEKVFFFTTAPGDDLWGRVLKVLGLPSAANRVVAFQLQEKKNAVLSDEVSQDTVLKFTDEFVAS